MEATDRSEQWLLNGDCLKCRREKYCSKPCTRAKRVTKAIIQGMVAQQMDVRTGGAVSAIMDQVKE